MDGYWWVISYLSISIKWPPLIEFCGWTLGQWLVPHSWTKRRLDLFGSWNMQLTPSSAILLVQKGAYQVCVGLIGSGRHHHLQQNPTTSHMQRTIHYQYHIMIGRWCSLFKTMFLLRLSMTPNQIDPNCTVVFPNAKNWHLNPFQAVLLLQFFLKGGAGWRTCDTAGYLKPALEILAIGECVKTQCNKRGAPIQQRDHVLHYVSLALVHFASKLQTQQWRTPH